MISLARLVAAVLVTSFLAPGFAAEIHLADGRILEGDIVSAPGEAETAIRTSDDGMVAVIRVPAAQVTQVKPGLTVREKALTALATKAAALTASGGDGASWWTLAQEAKTLKQNGTARKFAKETVRYEPNHAAARQFLGYELIDGKWLKGADASLAKGEVLFRNQWMSPAARDAILADEARAETDADLKRKRKLAELAVAKQEAELAAARRQLDTPPVENTAYFGTYTSTPTIFYKQPGRWVENSCQPAAPALQVQAQGQGNGYGWNLHYQR